MRQWDVLARADGRNLPYNRGGFVFNHLTPVRISEEEMTEEIRTDPHLIVHEVLLVEGAEGEAPADLAAQLRASNDALAEIMAANQTLTRDLDAATAQALGLRQELDAANGALNVAVEENQRLAAALEAAQARIGELEAAEAAPKPETPETEAAAADAKPAK